MNPVQLPADNPPEHLNTVNPTTHSCNDPLTEDTSVWERGEHRLTNEAAQQTPIQSQPSIYNGPFVTTPSFAHTHRQSPRFVRSLALSPSQQTPPWQHTKESGNFLKGTKRINNRFLSSPRHKKPQRAREWVNYWRNSMRAQIKPILCALQAHKMSSCGEQRRTHKPRIDVCGLWSGWQCGSGSQGPHSSVRT